MTVRQVNFDGLVGPTHHYGGLSYGNVPSMSNEGDPSNPREAALQGLEKTRVVSETGVQQMVLPPAPRPDLRTARRLGYRGAPEDILAELREDNPLLLSSLYSASTMWAANIATMAPSVDTEDETTHFTVANLFSTFHRSLEPPWTNDLLRWIFPEDDVTIHEPLPATPRFRDEGAANHLRLTGNPSSPGLHVFVHGPDPGNANPETGDFPVRQSPDASRAVGRLHNLPARRTFLVQQNPAVPAAGGFHNDLVAVANRNVLFYHEGAFKGDNFPGELKEQFDTTYERDLHLVQVSNDELSLEKAIESYLFNSQIVSLNETTMKLIVAEHVKDFPAAMAVLEAVTSGVSPLDDVEFVTLHQSMKNGGGPACLRLKTVLPVSLAEKLPERLRLDESLLNDLQAWIEAHYPEDLTRDTLGTVDFYRRCQSAYSELDNVLDLPGLYDPS